MPDGVNFPTANFGKWRVDSEGFVNASEVDRFNYSLDQWSNELERWGQIVDISLDEVIARVANIKLVGTWSAGIQGGINAPTDYIGLNSGVITNVPAGTVCLVFTTVTVQSNTTGARMDVYQQFIAGGVISLKSAGAPYPAADATLTIVSAITTSGANGVKVGIQCGTGPGPVLSAISGTLLIVSLGS